MSDTEQMLAKMRALNEQLSEAAYQYYQLNQEIMSNLEYDRLYDELVRLERETGVVLSSSVTQRVGYEVRSALPKVRHDQPMLSLDKTKNREDFRAWLKDQTGLLSWKMDGLTVVLTYEGSSLVQAVTRGDGEVGEEITANARAFRNVPLQIPFDQTLVLRGEAVMSYASFDQVNEALDPKEQYKNPRNLCSGTVRQLDASVTAARGVYFIAFGLVSAGERTFQSKDEQLRFLEEQGFTVVEYEKVTEETILHAVDGFEARIAGNRFPSDGLVLTYDSIPYSRALGRTAKYPRDSYALKWEDETADTVLRDIEWDTSRTGLVNPVAIFDPVELEGTTVQRASLHNVSIIRELKLGIGDEISVYKANMIIPQIAENKTKSGTYELPARCPRCGGETAVENTGDAWVLVCANPTCGAKRLRAFVHYVSRDAMNIEGLSEESLKKLIDLKLIDRFGDLYRLKDHQALLSQQKGAGDKSVSNLLAAIEKSSHTELWRLIHALGILNVGEATAKLLARHYHEDLDQLRSASEEELSGIEGVGPVIAHSIHSYFETPSNQAMLEDLLPFLDILPETEEEMEKPLAGMQIAVTGSLNHYAGRSALKAEIERLGGRVVSSVSAKTTLLINNDALSTSQKNQNARKKGVPIMTEDAFIETYLKA